MKRGSWLPCVPLLGLALAAGAHEGHQHGETAAAAQRSEITLSKPLQRMLGISSLPLGDAQRRSGRQLLAEVVVQPALAARVQAPQAGRLLAADAGWPLAGQAVQAGDTLALVETVLPARERSQRAAELAALEQRRKIALLNAERLRLQSQANGGATPGGNIYLEQAEADAAMLTQQAALLRQSLDARLPLRAEQAGRVQAVRASSGEMVSAGQLVFELGGGPQPRLAVRVFDPALLRSGLRAEAVLPDGRRSALLPRGGAPAAAQPGWTLWLDFAEAAPLPLAAGMPLPVELWPADAPGLALPRASVQGLPDRPHVWLHAGPERFERRGLRVLQMDAAWVQAEADLQPGDRLVLGGAALLAQYR